MGFLEKTFLFHVLFILFKHFAFLPMSFQQLSSTYTVEVERIFREKPICIIAKKLYQKTTFLIKILREIVWLFGCILYTLFNYIVRHYILFLKYDRQECFIIIFFLHSILTFKFIKQQQPLNKCMHKLSPIIVSFWQSLWYVVPEFHFSVPVNV